MNPKNIFSIFIIAIYVFTAMLSVHAFAMHGSPVDTHDTSHHMHDHENEDHKGDMKTCLTQSIGILIDNDSVLQEITLAWFTPPLPIYSCIETKHTQHIFSYHDPGWGQDSSFAKFLSTHYGSTIMHC